MFTFRVSVQMFPLSMPKLLLPSFIASFDKVTNSTGSGFPCLKIKFLLFTGLLLEETQFSLHKLKNKTASTTENKNYFCLTSFHLKNPPPLSSNLKTLTKTGKDVNSLSLLKRLYTLLATKYTHGHVYKWVSSVTEICYSV